MGTFKISLKLFGIILAAVMLPLPAYLVCARLSGPGPLPSALIVILSGIAASFAAAALIGRGLTGPMALVADSVKRFIAADYKLESAIPRKGWRESCALISSMNRLMLELSAYRAFQFNQVMEERGKAQALIETIPDGVLLADADGGVIHCNRAALGLLGIPKLAPETAVPGSVGSAPFAAALQAALSSPDNNASAEVLIPPRTYQVLRSRFLLTTLKRPGSVIVLRDVTAERELEKTKETFFQMLTHDMRAPLSSIMGYAQFLKTVVPHTTAGDNCMQTIIRAAKRLNGMIEDILNSTKLERGDMTLQPALTDAGDLLGRIREYHAPEAERKKVSLSSFPAAGEIEFTGDAALLERVVTNLLGNALKFTPADGSISLACRDEGADVVFTVADTGPGIPADKLELVFEKYVQMEAHKNLGFGLGLAMCKMAVELHKGRIWVESEVGKGSKFVFNIPKNPAGAPPQQAAVPGGA